MGVVESMAMGLPWKERGRWSVCWVGSVSGCWVGSVSGCWVLPWKGRGRESADQCSEEGVLPWKGRGSVLWRKVLLGLAVERKRIGALNRRSVSWEEDNGRIVSGFFLWFWFWLYFFFVLSLVLFFFF